MILLFDYICYLIISGSFVCHSNYIVRGLFQMYLPPSFNILDHISILVNVYRKFSQNWVLMALAKMESGLSFILNKESPSKVKNKDQVNLCREITPAAIQEGDMQRFSRS